MKKISFQLTEANTPQFLLGNRFLKTYKQTPARKANRLFIARQETKIIAAVRLENFSDYYWLRNLFVLEAYRHQGVGSQLISTVTSTLQTKPIYGFPYSYLDKFYSSLGFQACDQAALPDYLFEKHQNYQLTGKTFLIMRFQPKIV